MTLRINYSPTMLLERIATQGGNTFIIDTEEEVGMANRALERAAAEYTPRGLLVPEEIKERWRDLKTPTKTSRDTDAASLQAGPATSTCVSFEMYENKVVIVHAIQANSFAWAFRTQSLVQRSVSFNEQMWTEMVGPLCSSATSYQDEMERLAQVFVIFEILGGEKAGTTHDVGGFVGNDFVPADPTNLQQNCNCEAYTGAQILYHLSRQGLLNYVSFSAADPFVRLRYPPHQALKLSRVSDGTTIVIDTWLSNNAQPPFWGSEENWSTTVTKAYSSSQSVTVISAGGS